MKLIKTTTHRYINAERMEGFFIQVKEPYVSVRAISGQNNYELYCATYTDETRGEAVAECKKWLDAVVNNLKD